MKKIAVQTLGLISQEPAVVAALVNAVIALLLAFGIVANLSTEQVGAIVGGLALLSGLVVRSKVSPATVAYAEQAKEDVETVTEAVNQIEDAVTPPAAPPKK